MVIIIIAPLPFSSIAFLSSLIIFLSEKNLCHERMRMAKKGKVKATYIKSIAVKLIHTKWNHFGKFTHQFKDLCHKLKFLSYLLRIYSFDHAAVNEMLKNSKHNSMSIPFNWSNYILFPQFLVKLTFKASPYTTCERIDSNRL